VAVLQRKYTVAPKPYVKGNKLTSLNATRKARAVETTPFGNTLLFVSGALVFPNYENLFRHASGGISFLFPFFVIIVIITPPIEQYGLASYEVLEHFLPPLDCA